MYIATGIRTDLYSFGLGTPSIVPLLCAISPLSRQGAKTCTRGMQWSSQVIGIGRAPVVRLTIALTTLALAPTYHDLRAGRLDERWPGTCPARPGLRYATGGMANSDAIVKFHNNYIRTRSKYSWGHCICGVVLLRKWAVML